MARQRSASLPPKHRHRPCKSATSTDVYGLPLPESLHDAIEAERDNLSKAESLLGCLSAAMQQESHSAGGPFYPDVADMARDLVRQSINRLDSLALQQTLLRNKVRENANILGESEEKDSVGVHRVYPALYQGKAGTAHYLHELLWIELPHDFGVDAFRTSERNPETQPPEKH